MNDREKLIIPEGGGTFYTEPDDSRSSSYRVTLTMTNNTGSVVVNQKGVDSDTWFPLVQEGFAVTLDHNNTMRSVYAPCELQIVATNCGVRKFV